MIRRITALSEGLGSEKEPFTTDQRDKLAAALALLVEVYDERQEET